MIPDSSYNQTSFFEFEKNFKEKTWLPELQKYFPVTLLIFVIYTVATFWGRKYMEKKEPFNLRSVLVLWNCGFVVFSIACSRIIIAERLYVIQNYGFEYSVCHLESYTGPIALWGSCLFVLSKVVLLGDTAFLILRKNELTVLLWWHHISTVVYTWLMTAERQVSKTISISMQTTTPPFV